MKNSFDLKGKKIAILATDGFEQSELEKPRVALDEAGAETEIVSPEKKAIYGWDEDDWGDSVEVDVVLSEADPDNYDALVLPGGVQNPDKLRTMPEAVEFVRAFFAAGKPVGGDLSRPTIADRGRSGKGTQDDFLFLHQNGFDQCRGQMGR